MEVSLMDVCVIFLQKNSSRWKISVFTFEKKPAQATLKNEFLKSKPWLKNEITCIR